MDQNNMNGMNFVMGDSSSEKEEPVNSVQPNPMGTASGMVDPSLNVTPQAPQPINNMQPPQETQIPVMPNNTMGVFNQPQPINNMAQPQNSSMPINGEIVPPKNIVQAATTVSNPAPNGNNQPVTPLINNNQPTSAILNNTDTPVETKIQNDKLKRILIAVGVILVSLAIGIALGYVLFNKFGNGGSGGDEEYSDEIYYGE